MAGDLRDWIINAVKLWDMCLLINTKAALITSFAPFGARYFHTYEPRLFKALCCDPAHRKLRIFTANTPS